MRERAVFERICESDSNSVRFELPEDFLGSTCMAQPARQQDAETQRTPEPQLLPSCITRFPSRFGNLARRLGHIGALDLQ